MISDPMLEMLAYQNNWTGSTCAGQSADFAAV